MEIVAHHRSPRPAERTAVVAELQRAADSGAERIEIDVLMRDGGAVVAHDTRGAGGFEFLGLDDALELLTVGTRATLLADLKDADAATTLGRTLAAHGLGARTIVCGRLHAARAAAGLAGARAVWTLPAGSGGHPDARSGPWGLATGRARARVREAATWAVAEGGCAGLTVDRRFVNAGLLAAVHATGGVIYAWTADREREMRRLTALGVDGLITNEPTRALRVRADLAGGV